MKEPFVRWILRKVIENPTSSKLDKELANMALDIIDLELSSREIYITELRHE